MAGNPATSGPSQAPAFDSTAGQKAVIDQDILANEAELETDQQSLGDAKGQLAQYQSDRDQTLASYNPESAAGPRPEFTAPTPQDHFQDNMKAAPLMMALGALGGAFTKQHGITMLASTNAMMKGVVQGNADAYSDARKNYDEAYKQFQDKSQTWLDVYKAYSVAYKGRLDVQERAVQAANASVGIYEKDAQVTKKAIGQLVSVRKSLELSDAKIQHMSNEDVVAMIKAEVAKQNANSRELDANTRKTKVDTAKGDKDADAKEVANMGRDLLKQLDANPSFMTGTGGAVRRGVEFVGTATGAMKDDPATKFKDDAQLFRTKLTALLKSKGRMGADERKVLESAVDVIGTSRMSTTQGRTAIEQALKVVEGGFKGGAKPAVQTATNPKTGEKMYLVNGAWQKDSP